MEQPADLQFEANSASRAVEALVRLSAVDPGKLGGVVRDDAAVNQASCSQKPSDRVGRLEGKCWRCLRT